MALPLQTEAQIRTRSWAEAAECNLRRSRSTLRPATGRSTVNATIGTRAGFETSQKQNTATRTRGARSQHQAAVSGYRGMPSSSALGHPFGSNPISAGKMRGDMSICRLPSSSVLYGGQTGPVSAPAAASKNSRPRLQCSCLPGGSEVAVAAALFTLATAAVVPLYTLMLLAPDMPLTKRVMKSSIPWVVLGLLYLYLLALSWTPLTLPNMFSSKYWLPELPSITRMFSSTLTVASAWIHLLSLDLYAARNIYFEGLRYKVETRHSLCLCLLFAPVGLLCHSLTKAFSMARRPRKDSTEKTYPGFELP